MDFAVVARYAVASASGMRPSGMPMSCTASAAATAIDKRLRVGEADVLGRGDDQPTGDESRILPRLDHAGEVVHRGIHVRAADRLDERADHVVVLVALPVVAQQRAIHGLRDVARP